MKSFICDCVVVQFGIQHQAFNLSFNTRYLNNSPLTNLFCSKIKIFNYTVCVSYIIHVTDEPAFDPISVNR